MNIAEVRFCGGRSYLDVAGVVVAREGDLCRDNNLPEPVMPEIPEDELAHATIGGVPIADMDRKAVRFFRGDNWTRPMLEYVADRINRAAARARP